MKLLSMVQRQFFLLKGVGLATQDLTEEYNSVIDTVEAGREVTWADQSQEGNDSGDLSLIQSLQFSCIGVFWNYYSSLRDIVWGIQCSLVNIFR